MPFRDNKPQDFSSQSLAPQSVNAATNGTGVDLFNYDGALAKISFGALSGTGTPTLTFKLQESDDNATFNDVADSDLEYGTNGIVVSAANANASTIDYRTYMGNKRYLRWVCSAVSGTSPAVLVSANIEAAKPHAYLGFGRY